MSGEHKGHYTCTDTAVNVFLQTFVLQTELITFIKLGKGIL